MPRAILPCLLALLLPAVATADRGPLGARLLSAEITPERRVVLRLTLSHAGEGMRPVKPMPLRFRLGGDRPADAEIDIVRARTIASNKRPTDGMKGPDGMTAFDMELRPGESATIELPTRPLPEGHPALTKAGRVVLDLKSPGPGGNHSLSVALTRPADRAVEVAPPPPAQKATPPEKWPGAGFQRGVVYSSWDGTYPHRARWMEHLEHFRGLGVTWIQVMTFAHQPRVNGPEIEPMPAERFPTAFIAEARRQGFKVLVKPHVWSREFYDGSNRWRGSITMPDAATWDRWFANYGAFIEREAKLAADAGAEMFSVGLEYVEATRGHGAAWRKIIERVRATYPGLLTYAADGNHEARHVEFWDALDVIGIDAYFDVGTPGLLGEGDLTLGWAPHVAWMKALSEKHGRPIVYTEAGYPSVEGATRQPWKWPTGKEKVDPGLQAMAYETLMRVCTSGDWCRGVFWWKYYEKPERGTSHAHDYSPRGKAAEAVLRRWYTTPAP